MIKKILIFGFGSIGQKHKKALKKINKNFIFFEYDSKKKFKKDEIIKINPDFIIISTPTSLHLKNLIFFNSIFNNKIILIEKPLFDKKHRFEMINNNNKIFVGYNLRFHPIIQYLKKKIKNLNTFYIRAECYSYLPNWRSQKYTKVYSSSKKLGGGVANDLSHEIDFLSWIFGDIKKIFKQKFKISNLKISSDDTFILVGKINKILININLNFSSQYKSRKIFLDEDNRTLECDLINNHIKFYQKNSNFVKKISFKNNDSLLNMHKNIIKNNFKDLCNLTEACKTINIIN